MKGKAPRWVWCDGAWRDSLGGTEGHNPAPGYVMEVTR